MSEQYQKPKTMSELIEFCSVHGLPLRKMRFFIGEDYPGAKAFGIYQDADGDFVVYKNKADGSRAVRYQGPDEAYAVNEIYEKLKDEVDKRRPSSGRSTGGFSEDHNNTSAYRPRVKSSAVRTPVRKRNNLTAKLIIIFMIIAAGTILLKEKPKNARGYYRYDDAYYYYDNNDWYCYYGNDWYVVNDREFDDMPEHYAGEYYNSSYGVGDFVQSEFYDGYYERSVDDDYDNGYDYNNDYDDYDDYDWGDYDDYDDWDTGYTDWDDDW